MGITHETKSSGMLRLYLLYKQSSSGYNEVSNETAEFFDDACRISTRIDSMISLTCSLAGITVTVTIETYVEMLQKIFPEDSPDISTSELVSVHLGWSTANTSEMAMKWLKNRFPEKLISLKSEFIWPSRSPDLHPLDFLSSFLYERLNQEKIPSTIKRIDEQMNEIMESILTKNLQRVIGNSAVAFNTVL